MCYLSPMKYLWGILFFLLFQLKSNTLFCQQDTAKPKITIGGYLDAYYGYDFNKPSNGIRPYSVNNSHHNNFSLNLGYIDIKYTANRTRARFAPAIGTYMNANYAGEPTGFRNILEASAGIKLFEKKNIWVDAGVLSSPITYESPVSKENLVYTRSIGTEYSPYYLTGIKLTVPFNTKFTGYLYVVNGWQQIVDVNKGKSVVVGGEYKPTKSLKITGNVWAGSEQNLGTTRNRNRYFFDVYATYKPQGKRLSVSGGVYYGIQQMKLASSNVNINWWQANVAAQYQIASKFSVSARAEYFSDPDGAVVQPFTAAPVFNCSSVSACGNFQITPDAMFRIEARSFMAESKIFVNADTKPLNNSMLAIAALVVSF
jgi:hypothetical protein